jgi:hypothetical protein
MATNPRPLACIEGAGLKEMSNVMDSAILVCALVGAMAFGILAAYAMLRVCFTLMRPPQRPAPAKPQPQTAQIS